MEIEQAILGRRAVREYLNKPVPEEIIEKILKAGAMAPSAMGRQPCRFIVITDKKKIRELSDAVKAKAGVIGAGAKLFEQLRVKEDVIFYSAPLLVLIAADKNDPRGVDWSAVDCSLAAQNMMLQAYSLGIGSCYIGFAMMLKDDRTILKNAGIDDSQNLYVPLIFGYPNKWPKQKNREPNVQKRI